MNMNEEVKNEIIKAHIYGYSDAEIMQAMGVGEKEVAQALSDTKTIEEKTKYMKEQE